MIKCPVCEERIENTIQKCPKCGFADLRFEFINENELQMWQTYVVYPCRFAYQTSIAQTKELQRKLQKELSAIKKTQKDQREPESTTNNEAPSFKKLILDKTDGWFAQGNITYKRFYECQNQNFSTCEVSNVVVETLENRMTADFFVKKTFDFRGADSTYFIAFKWKLKDDYGIVVADGRWSNDKMQVGDVTKGAISVKGLDPSVKYVLELVND